MNAEQNTSTFLRENYLTRIVVAILVMAFWIYMYGYKDESDFIPETRWKYNFGYYSTPLIIYYCIYEAWRTLTYPYRLSLDRHKKRIILNYFLGSQECFFEQLEEYKTNKGTIFYITTNTGKEVKIKGKYRIVA